MLFLKFNHFPNLYFYEAHLTMYVAVWKDGVHTTACLFSWCSTPAKFTVLRKGEKLEALFKYKHTNRSQPSFSWANPYTYNI